MAKISAVTGNNTSFKKLVVGCIIRTFVASVIAAVVYMSATVIGVGICTEEVGYTVKYSADGIQFEDVYTHYYVDGEDLLFKDYDGKEEYYKAVIRGNVNNPKEAGLDKKQMQTVRWISQACTLIAFVSLIYAFMWSAGDFDANKTEFGGTKQDKLKGLKVGLVADSPFILAYLILVVTRALGMLNWYPTLYKVLTYFAFGINDTFMVSSSGEMLLTLPGALGLLIGLAVLPLVALIGYIIGEKHIIIKNAIIYKK